MMRNFKEIRNKVDLQGSDWVEGYRIGRRTERFKPFPYAYFNREQLEAFLADKACVGIKFYPVVLPNDDGKEHSNLIAMQVFEESPQEASPRDTGSESRLAGTEERIAANPGQARILGFQPCPDFCDDDQVKT